MIAREGQNSLAFYGVRLLRLGAELHLRFCGEVPLIG